MYSYSVLTVAGAAPVPAAHQRPTERTLESSNAGQESLVRPEPRGSVVVVHAEEGAGTGAAGAAGAETHHIHAFVHPREELPSALVVSTRTAKLREAARVRKRRGIKALIFFERGEGGGGGGGKGRVSHLPRTH